MEPFFNQNNIIKSSCSLCSKTFSTKKNLSNHQMTFHLKKYPFKCTYPNCTKAYSIESRLKVHLNTHSKEKPHHCDECNKSFSEKGYLKTHKLFHSSKRPFVCSICSKTYKTKGHLKDHTLVQHEDIKKYECRICNKCFGRSSTLHSHFRTHTGEKSIKCPIDSCGQYFSEKGNMEIHFKRHAKRLQLLKPQHSLGPANDESINQNVTRVWSNDTLFNGIEKIKTNIFIVQKECKQIKERNYYTSISNYQSNIIQNDNFILSQVNNKRNINDSEYLNEFHQSRYDSRNNNNSFLSSLL